MLGVSTAKQDSRSMKRHALDHVQSNRAVMYCRMFISNAIVMGAHAANAATRYMRCFERNINAQVSAVRVFSVQNETCSALRSLFLDGDSTSSMSSPPSSFTLTYSLSFVLPVTCSVSGIASVDAVLSTSAAKPIHMGSQASTLMRYAEMGRVTMLMTNIMACSW